jgi:hypothetical protein
MPDERGVWHLFAAEFVGNCGVADWVPNSRIIRAVSAFEAGPYTFAEEVLPPFAHNPQVQKLRDGTYTLWMIGTADAPTSSLFNDCRAGNSRLPSTRRPSPLIQLPGQEVRAYWSRNITGPWSRNHSVLLGREPYFDNPAPLVFRNGSVIVLTRGVNESSGAPNSLGAIALGTAANWQTGPYASGARHPIFPKDDAFHVGLNPCNASSPCRQANVRSR